MNAVKIWAGALVAMICAGCGAPLHKDYAGSDRAKLRIVLNDPKAYFLWTSAIDPSTCKQIEVFRQMGGDSNPDPARIGMLDEKPVDNGNMETHIPAAPTKLRFSALPTADAADVLFAMTPSTQAEVRGRQTSKCPVAAFDAESGKQYEVDVTVGPQRCEIAIYELSALAAELNRHQIPFQESACPANGALQ